MKMLPMFPRVDPPFFRLADFKAKKIRGNKNGITVGNPVLRHFHQPSYGVGILQVCYGIEFLNVNLNVNVNVNLNVNIHVNF